MHALLSRLLSPMRRKLPLLSTGPMARERAALHQDRILIQLPPALRARFSSPPDYFLYLHDESMHHLGLPHGAYVGIRATAHARAGDLTVVHLDGEISLREVTALDEETIELRSHPEHPAERATARRLARRRVHIDGIAVGALHTSPPLPAPKHPRPA